MTTVMKCDFCAQPGIQLTGETNGVIVCIDHARAQDPLGIVTPNPRPTCPVARFGRPHVWCFGFWHEGQFIADEYVKCSCGQIEYDG